MVVKDGAAFLFLDLTFPIVEEVSRETLELVVESGFAASTLVGLTCDFRADDGLVTWLAIEVEVWDLVIVVGLGRV